MNRRIVGSSERHCWFIVLVEKIDKASATSASLLGEFRNRDDGTRFNFNTLATVLK